METERYLQAKEFLGQTLELICIFKKYGSMHDTTGRSILLTSINTLDNVEILDHVWISGNDLFKVKLITNQTMKIKAKIVKRKRPSLSLFDDDIIDIRLSKIKLLEVIPIKKKKRYYFKDQE